MCCAVLCAGWCLWVVHVCNAHGDCPSNALVWGHGSDLIHIMHSHHAFKSAACSTPCACSCWQGDNLLTSLPASFHESLTRTSEAVKTATRSGRVPSATSDRACKTRHGCSWSGIASNGGAQSGGWPCGADMARQAMPTRGARSHVARPHAGQRPAHTAVDARTVVIRTVAARAGTC